MLTDAGVRALGFAPFEEGAVVTAEFHLLRVFSVRGMHPAAGEHSPPVVRHESECRFAIATSVNEACRALLGEDFVADEAAWAKEHQAAPPYLLVHLGPTPRVTATSGYMQRRDDALLTYNCFAAAKESLRKLEEQRIDPLVAGLVVALSHRRNPVQLVPRAREIVGKTVDGETLVDLLVTTAASAHVSSPITEAEWAEHAQRASQVLSFLPRELSSFYHKGLFEVDPLKRFLFFFLFIERFTHWSFGQISDHALHGDVPARLTQHAAAMAEALRSSAKNLSARFLWCARLRWASIGDVDIVEFRAIKRERDRLSHGETTTIAEPLALRAQELCEKLVLASVHTEQTTASPSAT